MAISRGPRPRMVFLDRAAVVEESEQVVHRQYAESGACGRCRPTLDPNVGDLVRGGERLVELSLGQHPDPPHFVGRLGSAILYR